jgi:uncharacterized protein (DUF1778 family)
MKLDPEETILLTQEEYAHILAVCANPPTLTTAIVEAVKRYQERVHHETKTNKNS